MVLAGNMAVFIFQSDPVPVSVAPNFLPNLQFATAITVGTITGDKSVQTITSLPGFAQLRKVNSLTIYQSGFTDMNSFSALRCPLNGLLSIFENDLLTSLRGLGGIQASPELGRLIVTTNPLLKPSSAFAPLSSLLGCSGSTVPSIEIVDVQVTGCTTKISSVDKLCAYVTSSTACPA
jgi:hypothetical protein